MYNKLKIAAEKLGAMLKTKRLTITTAESCTSGWIGSSLAAAKESTTFYNCGFITYTDHAKYRVLGVAEETLRLHSAVSEASVKEMACGAKRLSGDDIGIAVSGYAGPAGGTDGTPAGTVWFAWCLEDGSIRTSRQMFSGDNEQVVLKASLFSINEMQRFLKE
ncbi:CinA family protein [Pantoea sp. NPDC088449]|uniref:Amidohydrolase, PncC family n=1 Tax=Candidatus Pantoea floridensis TaxID=1938870 RepID=A0A286DR14_9GAMM|nr:nicotinamide-nucleotide amidohydrolase family protein [Pantoea floridensis]PIF07605.1 PncC family amidohydrolase [Enterobacteriaceae bacterium JKS000233]SOD61089.1 amidohydrolase, PncC family [Pantoea floridensis]